MSIRNRLASLEAAIGAIGRGCRHCARGALMFFRQGADGAAMRDGVAWPCDADGSVLCPKCGQQVNAAVMRRAAPPLAGEKAGTR